MRATGAALLGVLRQLLDRYDAAAAATLAPLVRFDPAAVRNTRDDITGVLRSAGALRFR
jgi:hypothetical protein